MAGQVLYRKWRPQRFEEILGQEHVTRTLQRALASDRIAHAYLFTGPRGTGKTSTARILAKAVNCTGVDPSSQALPPCNTCPTCLSINEGRSVDLIEIDAASNRGIDEIRDLRERVKYSPAELRYKVYIIDEVHMLTTEAFNALLKTLEEPPGHVIFILATTEPHRILPTVLSRCQRFDFRRLRVADIVQRLDEITQAEELQATRPALELIARTATGSMRDAESLLDQLLVYGREGTLGVVEVQALLGMHGSERVSRLAEVLIAGDLPAGLRLVQQLVDDGVDLRQFNREFVSYLRNLLFLALTRDGADLIDMTQESLAEMRTLAQRTNVDHLTVWVRRFSELDKDLRVGWYGQLPLELTLVEAISTPGKTPSLNGSASTAQSRPRSKERRRERAKDRGTAGRPPAPSPSAASERARAKADQVVAPPGEASVAVSTTAEDVVTPVAATPAGGLVTLQQVQESWPQVLEWLRPVDPSVQALLHGSYCEPVAVEENIIVLGFRYAFHKGKIEETRNRRLVERVLSKVLGAKYGLRCVLEEAATNVRDRRRQAQEREKAQRDPRVQAAANIFNARIVDVQTDSEEE
jgi:DNA polymerase-3 subunit gamma/tau